MTEQEIESKYLELCNTPSDISDHLPILKEYADRCDTVVEFGVRGAVSTMAFLASKCKRLISYDILDVEVPKVDKFTFICASSLDVEIPQTDMLMVDSLHTGEHLEKELALHANKVNKYLIFHDVGFFGECGEDGSKGLMYAIRPFMEEQKEWQEEYFTTNNNGLLILKRAK